MTRWEENPANVKARVGGVYRMKTARALVAVKSMEGNLLRYTFQGDTQEHLVTVESFERQIREEIKDEK
jgi:hypothetical protein